jgi:hypothetical protein
MKRSVQEACDFLIAEIKNHDGNYKKWYVGVTYDAKKRLFEEHMVVEKDNNWTFCSCANDTDARKVEKELIELGCDGAPGGGDNSSVRIYVYLKTNQTKP